LELVVSQGAL
jgi:hypothetical protein